MVAAETVAAVPLNLTVLLAGVALKFVPVIVTEVPTAPPVGVKLVMVGVTVKLLLLVPVKPPTVTEIVPVVAPEGTMTTSCVVVAVETVATVPLNLTVSFAFVALKFVPVIVTEMPTAPLPGENPEMVGAAAKALCAPTSASKIEKKRAMPRSQAPDTPWTMGTFADIPSPFRLSSERKNVFGSKHRLLVRRTGCATVVATSNKIESGSVSTHLAFVNLITSTAIVLLRVGILVGIFVCAPLLDAAPKGTTSTPALSAFGQAIFEDKNLSLDRHTSCQSCHTPANGYADPRPRSIGSNGRVGTRNAPSLAGIADDSSFFWDGRRTRLEDVVLDAFTNPAELALPSTEVLLDRLLADPHIMAEFKMAFPASGKSPTLQEVRLALVSFIHSLTTGASLYDRYRLQSQPLSALAERGRQLFEREARCSECHAMKGNQPRFSDQSYHASVVEQPGVSEKLPDLARAVIEQRLEGKSIGPKVLTDVEWSALGRFVVSRNPVDIGAFRTPSLRNVAISAPYMHDGSVATLEEAVDREIYYRSIGNSRSIDLTSSERAALVEFLKALTDERYKPADREAARTLH